MSLTDSAILHGLELGETTFERGLKYELWLWQRGAERADPGDPYTEVENEIEQVLEQTMRLYAPGGRRLKLYADFVELLVGDGPAPVASAERTLAEARKLFLKQLVHLCSADEEDADYILSWDHILDEIKTCIKERVEPRVPTAAWLDTDARWAALPARLSRLVDDKNFIGERIKIAHPSASFKKIARMNELFAIHARANALNLWDEIVHIHERQDGVGLFNLPLPWNEKRRVQLRPRPRAGQHHRNEEDSGEEEGSVGRMSTRRAALYGQRGSARALLG